jgi:hypothetical protein
MTAQLDLFAPPNMAPSPVILRQEERFGMWDAKTGFPLRNDYSERIAGERLAAYERGFRRECGLQQGNRHAEEEESGGC